MDFNGSYQIQNAPEGETKLTGLPVARGLAIGNLIPLHGGKRQFFRAVIPEEKIVHEIDRLERAIARSFTRLKRLSKESSDLPSHANILDAQLAILEGGSFIDRIREMIHDDKVNAEWAVSIVGDDHIARIRALPDEHLRERYLDVEDVVELILSSFSKQKGAVGHVPHGSVIAAEELRPSTLVDLGRNIVGCVTEHGGWTSHTFILAREMGIPAVTGIPNLLRLVERGQVVLIDGFNGEVIINPAETTIQRYVGHRRSTPVPSEKGIESTNAPIKTLDGREITIRVNADSVKNVRRARSAGAKGIGLFRTEALFSRFNGFPTERQQYETFIRLADAAGPDGIKVRTFDISARRSDTAVAFREKNPALGLRGIRLALEDTTQLRAQFRAILRASAHSQVDVILPMVAGIQEILDARSIFETERDRLKNAAVCVGNPSFGVMIEVPSAVMIVDRILDHVDFVCLGTNDLVQYLLAVDRDNESVANWFRTLHPAVISAISTVLEAGKRAAKPVIVCGEMAGSPFYTPLLIGLGAVEFSMNPNSIGRVAKVIRGIAYEEVLELVKQVRNLSLAEEIERHIITTIQEKWIHLFPEDFLTLRKI